MKHLLFIIFGLFCCLGTQAQNISVQSFRLDERDITAVKNRVVDMNGEKCALIKVETTQQGFSFDRVVKTEQKVGEIWVYVPEGTHRLTISHNQYGILQGYDLGQSLKGGYTYILKLNTNNQTATRTLTPEETYNKGLEYFNAKDYKTAFNYFIEAAQKGYFKAQNHLGTMYHTGLGINKNDKEAVKWFRKAADQGDAFALFSMGNMYENGYGIAKDYGKAEECYKKALTKDPNNTYIKKGLASVQKRIAEEEKSIAQDNTHMVSDVDKNIPLTTAKNPNILAVVIGNEKYSKLPDVPYAENDAKMFREYCEKTLGVTKDHIKYLPNAGFVDIYDAVEWLKTGTDSYGGDASVIFYYAGHGLPDPRTGSQYLLPADVDGKNLNLTVSLQKLYDEFAQMPTRSVAVFLDACFSGVNRDNQMVTANKGARLAAVKSKPATPSGNTIVFSATEKDQTAHPFTDQKHGFFTYFLLRKLQESKGDTTFGEIADYVTKSVRRTVFDKIQVSQTPSVSTSGIFSNDWRQMKFK